MENIYFWAIISMPFSGAFAQDDKKPEPKPLTTNNPSISIEELEYLVEPLTKDDLMVEATGWLQILKKHVSGVSELKIQTLTAEGDVKTKLLENVNKVSDTSDPALESPSASDRARI